MLGALVGLSAAAAPAATQEASAANATLATVTLDEPLLRAVAAAGGGRYENVTDDRGLRALVSELRELSGARPECEREPFDVIFLLSEGALDAGRMMTGRRAEGTAWGAWPAS